MLYDRPKKWHVYKDYDNDEGAFPLCWEGMAIEFNSEWEATKFIEDHPEIGEDFIIKEDVLYFKGGYITSTAALALEEIERGY